MKRQILFLVIIGISIYTIAQTGPGGISTNDGTSSLVLWLRADYGLTLNGPNVTDWADFSGYNNNAIPSGSEARPSIEYSVLNNQPAIYFDGNNDDFVITDNYSLDFLRWHVYMVVKPKVPKANNSWISKGSVGDENLAIISDIAGSIKTPIVFYDRTANFITTPGAAVVSSDFSIIEYSFIPTAGRDIYKNNGVLSTDDDLKVPAVNNTMMLIGDQGGSGQRNLNGYISEIIIFNNVLNEAQKIVVNNYLSAKYDIPLSSDDLYNLDDHSNGDYDYDVAGIGRIDADNIHNDSKGTGIVRINDVSGLDDGEWLFWGHNNGQLEALNYSDLPEGVEARSNRIWKVNEIGETGTVTLSFDFSGLGYIDPTHLRLIIDSDNDGIFADEDESKIVMHNAIYDESSGMYKFIGVSLTNNQGFTFGTSNKMGSPLPVQLTSFYTEVDDNREFVKCIWNTASEYNSDYFTVEKSRDAIQWEEVGSISAAGNCNSEKTYLMYDYKPATGITYYRLKQTDFGGKSYYSAITTANISELLNNELIIYPNPIKKSKKYANLKFEDNTLISLVEILSLGGQVVKTYNGNNSNKIAIDINELDIGTYIIRVNTKNQVYTKRLLIEY